MVFKPGQSGNLLGNSFGAKNRKLLGDRLYPHAEDFVRRLVQLSKSPDEAIALAAIREGLDRIYGKSAQAINISGEGPPLRLVIEAATVASIENNKQEAIDISQPQLINGQEQKSSEQ